MTHYCWSSNRACPSATTSPERLNTSEKAICEEDGSGGADEADGGKRKEWRSCRNGRARRGMKRSKRSRRIIEEGWRSQEGREAETGERSGRRIEDGGAEQEGRGERREEGQGI